MKRDGRGREEPEVETEDELSEAEILRREMADVVPIEGKTRRIPRTRKKGRTSPGWGTLSQVQLGGDQPRSGNPRYGDPRLVKKLRRGAFPVQDEIDLHGFTQSEARKELEAFLLEASRRRLTCVRIIHGKGWNSPNRLSVLRKRVPEWLVQGAVGELVAAFVSAPIQGGGSGALDVVLKVAKEKG